MAYQHSPSCEESHYSISSRFSHPHLITAYFTNQNSHLTQLPCQPSNNPILTVHLQLPNLKVPNCASMPQLPSFCLHQYLKTLLAIIWWPYAKVL